MTADLLKITGFHFALLLRLVAAFVLGGIIGLERERTNHEAGLRTHMILCLGTASIMVLSESIILEYGIPSEVLRMAAQVISGIGFLGAGSIIINRNQVRGVTTAAGLWTTACVGLSVGAGYYIIAATTVALMMLSLLGLRTVAKRLRAGAQNMCDFRVDLPAGETLEGFLARLKSAGVEIGAVALDVSGSVTRVGFTTRLEDTETIRALLPESTD